MARQLRIEFERAFYHLDSVRAKIVQKPGDYRWTSYSAYIDRVAKCPLVDTTDTLSCFSNKEGKATKRYKAFVEAEIVERENPFEDVEGGIILGGKGFKAEISEFLDKIEANEELPQIERLREDVGIDKVMRACCSFYGKAREDLLKRGKGKSKKR